MTALGRLLAAYALRWRARWLLLRIRLVQARGRRPDPAQAARWTRERDAITAATQRVRSRR